MKIEKKNSYRVRCYYLPERWVYVHAENKKQAKKLLEKAGWRDIDGKTLCPDCVYREKEHNHD